MRIPRWSWPETKAEWARLGGWLLAGEIAILCIGLVVVRYPALAYVEHSVQRVSAGREVLEYSVILRKRWSRLPGAEFRVRSLTRDEFTARIDAHREPDESSVSCGVAGGYHTELYHVTGSSVPE